MDDILQEPEIAVTITTTTITYVFVGQDVGDDSSVVVCGDD